MKKILIGISLYLLLVFLSYGQEFDKKLLYGTWTGGETGEPGRTIQKNDSTYVSLPPVTYSVTTIKLKRFGKAVKTTKGYHGMILDSEFKGKWKLAGDTLSLRFRHPEEIYLIDQSIEDRIFFKSLTSGRLIYRRKE